MTEVKNCVIIEISGIWLYDFAVNRIVRPWISVKKQGGVIKMDNSRLKEREAKMRKDNAVSVLKKILAGTCVILMVGICAYAFLFALMLMI